MREKLERVLAVLIVLAGLLLMALGYVVQSLTGT